MHILSDIYIYYHSVKLTATYIHILSDIHILLDIHIRYRYYQTYIYYHIKIYATSSYKVHESGD